MGIPLPYGLGFGYLDFEEKRVEFGCLSIVQRVGARFFMSEYIPEGMDCGVDD